MRIVSIFPSSFKLAASFALAGAMVTTIALSSSYADDLDSSLVKVKELVGQKNYPKALEELGWARKEIEKMNSSQLGAFLPDSLAGFTAGKLESSAALGFTNLEREYSKGDLKIKVSLTGSSGTGLDAGMGGLASLGKMAAMFGGSTPGQETLRIQGRTAILNTESTQPDLTVFLDSGSILKIEMSKGNQAAVLKDIASALKIDDLEKYLKGSK